MNELLRLLSLQYPEAQFVTTYFFKKLMEQGWEACRNDLWDESGSESTDRQRTRSHLPSLTKPLLIIPIFVGQECGHFSVVIRERLNNGKLIYFQLDPDPTYTGDIRSYFERTATRTDVRQETLWNSAPGMTEWHRITVPRQAETTLDCAPLTCNLVLLTMTI